jgi:four helix bundle protein
MYQVGYKKYIAWQKSDELAYQVYLVSRKFPKDELYGITSQLRRAVLSVPTNLAEGLGRQHRNETKQFLNIALGSISEVEYLLGFSNRLGLLNEEEYRGLDALRQDVSNLVAGMFRSFSRGSSN